MYQLSTILPAVRLNVRLSRGKWNQIAQESGCRWSTLTRIANEADYDPRFSEFARIYDWFEKNGSEGASAPVSAA